MSPSASPRRRTGATRPAKLGSFRIGTSGWQYDHWVGPFYPEGLPKSDWLEYYARYFDTVEVNNTFYHLPRASTFDSWRIRAAEGFCYALKFSRFGSHLKRLIDPEDTIGLFLERADRLAKHLGPILVQLPPRWDADPDRLARFLDVAPSRHRWALEFRDPSWLSDTVFTVLRDHNAALCIHDLILDHPRELTADWTCLRFHGPRGSGSYSHQALAAQADHIREYLSRGLDTFAYFNNDAHGYAPANAAELKRLLA